MSTQSSGTATDGDLSVIDAAAQLNVSRFTIYRLIHARELVAYRAGRRKWRITRDALAAYRAANSNQPVAA